MEEEPGDHVRTFGWVYTGQHSDVYHLRNWSQGEGKIRLTNASSSLWQWSITAEA